MITFYFFVNFQLAFHSRLIALCGYDLWETRARDNHAVVMQMFDQMSKNIEFFDGLEVNEELRSSRRELVVLLNIQNEEFITRVQNNYRLQQVSI